jgi:hypothetical protein
MAAVQFELFSSTSLCYQLRVGGSATMKPEAVQHMEPSPTTEAWPVQALRGMAAAFDNFQHGFLCSRIETSENKPTARADRDISPFDADARHHFATKVIPHIEKQYCGHDDPWKAAFDQYSVESCAGGFSRPVLGGSHLTDLFYAAGYVKPYRVIASPGHSITNGIFGHNAITLEEFRTLASMLPRGTWLRTEPAPTRQR